MPDRVPAAPERGLREAAALVAVPKVLDALLSEHPAEVAKWMKERLFEQRIQWQVGARSSLIDACAALGRETER
jgi:hypothetical protein